MKYALIGYKVVIPLKECNNFHYLKKQYLKDSEVEHICEQVKKVVSFEN